MRWFRGGPRTPPWLIVGLGNPGPRYERNRHNVGFMVVDKLAERYGITVGRKRPYALVGEGNADLGGGASRVVLAKPRTYMNESGEAVVRLAQASGAPKDRMVVVYDDLDLPLGKLRVRARGSAGGHKGIKSIAGQAGDGRLSQDSRRHRAARRRRGRGEPCARRLRRARTRTHRSGGGTGRRRGGVDHSPRRRKRHEPLQRGIGASLPSRGASGLA